MLRPAHSLAKFQGAGNIALELDPVPEDAEKDYAACLDQGGCSVPTTSPVDLEYRIGLGRGFELGLRGLFPPHVVDIKYSVLDERRYPVPFSLAVHAEGGLTVSTTPQPIARGDLIISKTQNLSETIAIQPVASGGWWLQQDRSGTETHGFGWTGGLFVPIAIPAEGAVAPYVGASGFVPLDGEPEWYLRAGLLFEPWLERTGPDDAELGRDDERFDHRTSGGSIR